MSGPGTGHQTAAELTEAHRTEAHRAEVDRAAAELTETDRVIAGTGTPARRWRESAGWQAMPVVGAEELVPPGARLLVLAPHPDDEVLAAGALLRLAARGGRQVSVIAVTDGEASHPGSTEWPVRALARQRRAESAAAMLALGLPPGVLHRLGIPDGSVGQQQAALTDQLRQLIRPADVVVTPWQLDGHPDHEAVARAAGTVAGAVGARWLQAPIWGWHWAEPEHPAFPWSRLVALELDVPALASKRQAVAAFVSQLRPDPSTGAGPILPDWALDRLVGDREVFLR